MNSNIQQLALESEQTLIDRMIPIFIGTSKTLYSDKPIFTDNTYNTIQLNSNNDYIIDQLSINPLISYWKEITSEFIITNSGPTNIISVSIPTATKFDSNSLFIIYDNSNNLLFSSSIKSLTYNIYDLISIELKNQLLLTGSLKCKLLLKVKETIPYTYDNINKQINLQFINKSINISFPNVIINESLISYNYTNSYATIKKFITITEEDILNEKNIELSKGLSLSNSAIIISIPNDSFIMEAIEILKLLNIGYYIVPISLSFTSLFSLISFVKEWENENKYLSLLIPALLPSTIVVGSGQYSGSYISSGYVVYGYVN